MQSFSYTKRGAPANLAGCIYSFLFPESRQEKRELSLLARLLLCGPRWRASRSGAAPAPVCQVLGASVGSEGEWVTPSKDELSALPPRRADSTTQEPEHIKQRLPPGGQCGADPGSCAARAASPARRRPRPRPQPPPPASPQLPRGPRKSFIRLLKRDCIVCTFWKWLF